MQIEEQPRIAFRLGAECRSHEAEEHSTDNMCAHKLAVGRGIPAVNFTCLPLRPPVVVLFKVEVHQREIKLALLGSEM
jgi:hypothetical protein